MTSVASFLGPPSGDTDERDFSLVLGGPLYQLLRRAHIAGDALELVRRRIVAISLFAWLPLLLLSAWAGELFSGSSAVPFFYDIQVHVRFLIAVPLLIAAEILVHQRLRPVVSEFLTRGLVPGESIGAFHEAVRTALSWRNSIVAELAMIAIVYGIGVPVIWRELSFMSVPTWYATAQDGGGLTLAGTWYAYVSVPLFQFLLLRWYYRMIIWMRFLWHASRIRLNISAMHGDRMAGLGFLAKTVNAFVPLAMAHGALLAGTIANRVLFLGAKLVDSRVEIAIVVAFLLILVFGPLAVFAPLVARAKRAAASTYGRLAQRYVSEFEATWIPAGVPASQSPLGTGDIQSLADLASSMEVLRGCRIVPITRDAVILLVSATLIPVSPLILTVIPLEEVGKHLLKLLL